MQLLVVTLATSVLMGEYLMLMKGKLYMIQSRIYRQVKLRLNNSNFDIAYLCDRNPEVNIMRATPKPPIMHFYESVHL